MGFPPLAGRETELTLIRSVIDDAARGTATTLLVSGEAGVGKTSLVAHVDDGEAEVIRAICLPLTLLAAPLLPLRAALRQAGCPPVLDGTDPVLEFDAWLDRATRDRPVILVVDDLQWADQSTLDVLMYVIAGHADRRLAVVLTRRLGESVEPALDRWLGHIWRLPRVRRLDLGRIDRAATGDQLAALLGGLPHASLIDDVYARTGGNPFLTRLLVREVAADAMALPPQRSARLRDVIAGSWTGLSRPARDLMSVLAVAGRPLRSSRLAELAAAAGFPQPVLPLLAETVAAGVLRTGPEQRYWFTHPLLAEVLTADLLPERRQLLHSAFAAALEPATLQSATPAVGVERAVLLADHYFHADRPGPAYHWALRAAEAAVTAHAASEALRLLKRAAELWPRVPEPGQPWAALQERIRQTARLSGDDVTELAAVEELLAGAPASAELIAWRAQLRRTTGIEFSGPADLREAVRLAEPFPDSSAYALAMALQAQAELWHGDADGPKHARAAIRLARAHGPGPALFFALIARSMVWRRLDDPAGIAVATEALAVASRMPPGYELVLAVFWIARSSFAAGSGREILELFRTNRERFARDGLAHAYLARLAGEEALVLLDLGHWAECQAQLRFCLGMSCGLMADTKVRLISAQLACRQGRTAEADAHLARAEELFTSQSSFLPFRFDEVRAELATAAGDLVRVLECFDATLASGQVTWRILPHVAQALADEAERQRDRAGDVGPVLARLAVIRRRHPRVEPNARGYLPYERAQLIAYQAWYDAEAARARGPARDAWHRAAEAAVAAELPWEQSYCLARLAEATRSRVAAASALREANRLAAALGAAPLLARIEALAQDSRIALTTPASPAPDDVVSLPGLTMRERQILPYVVAGHTYAEIAGTLFVSVKTVSVHVSNMLQKTGLRNRTELSRYARRMGINP